MNSTQANPSGRAANQEAHPPGREMLALCSQSLLWLWLRHRRGFWHTHADAHTDRHAHTPYTCAHQSPKVNNIITNKKPEPWNLPLGPCIIKGQQGKHLQENVYGAGAGEATFQPSLLLVILAVLARKFKMRRKKRECLFMVKVSD